MKKLLESLEPRITFIEDSLNDIKAKLGDTPKEEPNSVSVGGDLFVVYKRLAYSSHYQFISIHSTEMAAKKMRNSLEENSVKHAYFIEPAFLHS